MPIYERRTVTVTVETPPVPPPPPDYLMMGLGALGAIIVASIIATWTHEQGWWKFPWEG